MRELDHCIIIKACRMQKMIGLTLGAMMFWPVGCAHAQDGLRGYTCAQVREAVIRYGGPENAESLARSNGGTDREIAAARHCLRPKHFGRS